MSSATPETTPEATPHRHHSAAPLILTLSLAGEAQDWFEAQRRRHFPAARNQVPAHITLFHALPGDEEGAVCEALAREAARGPFTLDVTGLKSLGRGVAYEFRSDALQERRRAIAREFAPRLTAQDASPYRPHLTIQNKVDPRDARALLETLRATFVPHTLAAHTLHAWRYLGGPWEPLLACPIPARPA